ncbi:MAG: phage major tail tube protein [Oscillospiraceae bacterium]
MNLNETIINFDIYEDATAFYGTAKVKLPDIQSMTNTISGAGISGEYEAVTLGHVSAMSMSLDFRTTTSDVIRLYEQRRHTLDIRAAQQSEDSATGKIVVDKLKYVVVATPKKLSPGSLAPSSPADASGEFSVSYIAEYINGTKVLEVDPLNYIYFVNGTDYLAEVRAALGR